MTPEWLWICPRLRGQFFCAALVLAGALPAQAAPYRPVDDAQLLERLPAGLNGRMLRSVRARTYDADVAARLARAYIERGRRDADPRDFGYAQGLLAPWWQDANPPLPVLLLRATLRQGRHDFPGALKDLDLYLAQRPADAQAWLTRATVMRVTGRYADAAVACERLQGLAAPFVTELCRVSVAGFSGQLAASYERMLRLRDASSAQASEIRSWMYAELGEMAERLAKPAEAQTHYLAGLAAAPGDHGLRAAYADLLLETGRGAQVPELVGDLDRVDALRLRHALALKSNDAAGFQALDAQIEAAYAAAHLRGEDLHLREEARYALQAHGDAQRALVLAQANWNIQHEPWDARLLLMAAQAAAKPEAGNPVRLWLAQTRMQDARLAPYLELLAP